MFTLFPNLMWTFSPGFAETIGTVSFTKIPSTVVSVLVGMMITLSPFLTLPASTLPIVIHAIMVPVEQRYPQGGVRISPFDLQLVEHLQQRLLRRDGVAFFGARIPPATCLTV